MSDSLFPGLRRRWDIANPKQKQRWILMLVLLILLVLAGISAVMMPTKIEKKVSKEIQQTVMVPEKRDLSAESLAAQLESFDRRLAGIEGQQRNAEMIIRDTKTQLQTKIEEVASGASSDERLTHMIEQKFATTEERLKREVHKDQSPPQAPVMLGGAPGLTAPLPNEQGGMQQMVPAEPPKPKRPSLRVVDTRTASSDKPSANSVGSVGPATPGQGGADASAPSAAPAQEAIGNMTSRDIAGQPKGSAGKETWLPAGSMFQGVLLTGMDAPTSGAAQKNPTPALVRIKTDAILPNRFKQDIKECFVLVSGYGVMSTERANLRTEMLSCVRADGGVIETKLDGYLVGDDGKVGLRGRLVSKQGSIIAKAGISGLLSGFSGALQPQAVPAINTGVVGANMQTQQMDMSQIMESGLYKGASNSLNQISKFYLDMAKEIFPVIEIDAMRSVTVILVRGAGLKLK
jgi:conjugal transfer pilus assembly protein TraB